MTATSSAHPGSSPGSSDDGYGARVALCTAMVDGATARGTRPGSWWAAVAVVVVAAGLRLYQVTRSYDIFIDEVTYSQIAHNLATGHGLTLYGRPFLLHPPLGLVELAAGLLVLGTHGTSDQVLLHLRVVTAMVGALICGGAYLLVRRAQAPRAALATALLVCVDPFVVQYDSQVMLESLAQVAVVGLMILAAVAVTTSDPLVRRRSLVGAAGATAATMATKETFGLVVVMTLLILWATGWVLTRRQARRVLLGGVLGYLAVTLGSALVWGGPGAWLADKVHGAERLVGLAQETGFNAPSTHVTLASRVTANLSLFGPTYLLLALGGLATLAVLHRLAPWRSDWADASGAERVALLIGLWSLAACAYLAYAIAFGSLEEQMFYIMTLPVIANLCLWVDGRLPHWRPMARRTLVVALAALVLVDLSIWTSVHTRPDNAYQQFLVWERANIRPGQVVSVTEFTAQFLITNAVLGEWPTLAEMQAHHVDYVLVITNLVEQGYGLGTPAMLRVLEARAPLAFQAQSRGEGRLQLYDVRGLTGGSRP